MNIGLYTSKRYYESKKQALDEAVKKLGLSATVVDKAFEVQPSSQQTFGFEELFHKAKMYASEALKAQDIDIGVGIGNSLSFIYAANEWYYVICVALQTKDGRVTASFTPGISVPLWMVKEVQDTNVKVDAITERLTGNDDPVTYFSGKTLTRKDLMAPALLLAFSKLGLDEQAGGPGSSNPIVAGSQNQA